MGLSWLQAQHLAFRTDFWLSLGQGPFHNLHRAVCFFLGTTRIFAALSRDAWKNFKIIEFFAVAEELQDNAWKLGKSEHSRVVTILATTDDLATRNRKL